MDGIVYIDWFVPPNFIKPNTDDITLDDKA